MLIIKKLNDQSTAKKIAEFLTGPDAFEDIWAPAEKTIAQQSVFDSLNSPHHQYWYIEDNNQIVAAMGVRENKYGSGGYEMATDYAAVHQDYRNQGLASQLLEQIEKYVEENGGRYIHILSCDLESYAAARNLYLKHGYKHVGAIPHYYLPNVGRVDYIKALSN